MTKKSNENLLSLDEKKDGDQAVATGKNLLQTIVKAQKQNENRESEITFSDEVIAGGVEASTISFNEQFAVSGSLTLGRKILLRRQSEDDTGEKKENKKEVDSVSLIPIYHFISYQLGRRVAEGKDEDHSLFQNWEDADKKDTVAISYGAPKSGFCPTRGNFDLNGYGSWLDDKAKRKRLRVRMGVVGFLETGELTIFRFGSSAVMRMINYQNARKKGSVPLWYFPMIISAKSENGEDGKEFVVPDFSPDKTKPILPDNETAVKFFQRIASPLIEIYREYARSFETLQIGEKTVENGNIYTDEKTGKDIEVKDIVDDDDIPF